MSTYVVHDVSQEIFLTCNIRVSVNKYCSLDETAIGGISVTEQSRTELVSLCCFDKVLQNIIID